MLKNKYFAFICFGLGILSVLFNIFDREFFDEMGQKDHGRMIFVMIGLPATLALSGYFQFRKNVRGRELFFVYSAMVYLWLVFEVLFSFGGGTITNIFNSKIMAGGHVLLASWGLIEFFREASIQRKKYRMQAPARKKQEHEKLRYAIKEIDANGFLTYHDQRVVWSEVLTVGKQLNTNPFLFGSDTAYGSIQTKFYVKTKQDDRKYSFSQQDLQYVLKGFMAKKSNAQKAFSELAKKLLQNALKHAHITYEFEVNNETLKTLDPAAELERLSKP